MTDCVLVKPPIVEYESKMLKLTKYTYGDLPPIGLLYVAAVLEKNNIDVQIIDADVENLSLTDCFEKIRKISPPIVGVTAMSTFVGTSAELLNLVKNYDQSILTVMGGPHPTALPEKTLKDYSAIDVVIKGEGEYSMLELCKSHLKSNINLSEIDGICYRDREGNIISTPSRPFIKDLDALPFPARHLLPIHKYKINTVHGEKGITTAMSTSRGCPYKCAYCGQPYGNKVRFRSAESVVDEIKEIRSMGINHINFIDDTMTINKKRIVQICEKIIKEDLDIQWACTTRVDCVDKPLLKMMKKAGCKRVDYGIESGNQEVLNLIQKDITLNQARNAVRITKEVGLDVVTYFMLGLPGETKKTIEDTINFAFELNPDMAQFSILVPLPNTKIWDMAKNKEHGLIMLVDDVDGVGKYSGKAVIRVNDLSEYALPILQNLAFKRFYIRPAYMWMRLKRLNNYTKFINTVKAGLIELFGEINISKSQKVREGNER